VIVKRTLTMVYFSMFPSTHAIGPASTVANLAAALSEDFDITVLSLNFDRSRRKKLFAERGVVAARASQYKVLYLPYTLIRFYELCKALRTAPGALTIHCLYDFRLSIPALLISLVVQPSRSIIHLPHGIFMDVINKKHRLRKRMFCWFLSWKPIRTRVVHIASSWREMIEVKKRVGPDAKVVVISHFFGDLARFLPNPPQRKVAGALAIGFVGRVTEQKNLIFAIEALASAGVAAELHVFGEAVDMQYLAECQRVARDRNVSVLVQFRGRLAKEGLFRELAKMDLFFSPTLGENFGQAIFEALSLGLPVLLSTETPWLDVASHHAGWALDLADKEEFAARIRFAFDADEETWGSFRGGARRYATAKSNNPALLVAWHEALEIGERHLD
jgi:glycosyltransferase involved in cell wall biosynthesis